jgi:hypothetical protein
VYAATRCAGFVARPELGPPLTRLLGSPEAKVTSTKEAARLLGSLRPPGAVDVLLAAFDGEGVHRDLRVAIARSLRSSLDDDRVWRILTALPSGTDDEAGSLLEITARHLPSRHRTRYAALVLDLSRASSRRVRAEALSALAGWARWSPGAPAAACLAIEDFDAGPE